MDKFMSEFISIILRHVETISDDEYLKHTSVSEHGQSIYLDETWRGFARRSTRRELIDKAWSVNTIKPSNYMEPLLNNKTLTIGCITAEYEGRTIISPVYYFPDRGIYAAACGEDYVYDAWLSWPCYPKSW